MPHFMDIEFAQAVKKKDLTSLEEILRAIIALRNTNDANFALVAMLKNPDLIAILNDHPEMHNRLLTFAIKMSYPDAVGLLIGEDFAGVPLDTKSKDTVKVLIQTLANSPDLFDENYQLLELLCANEKFRQMLGLQVKGMLKQVNRDLKDKKALKDIKEKQGLGAIDAQRLRAVQAIILVLQKYEDATTLIDTSDPKLAEKNTDAITYIEKQKSIAADNEDALKKIKSLDQFSSLNLGEFRTPELNSYIAVLIAAIKANDVQKVENLLDRSNPNFGKLKPVELNQLLHVALVFRSNNALRKMLDKPQFQACVAGPAFRNRLLCFALDTANPAAATAFLAITAVGTRMEETSKDVLKNFIQGVGYMPASLKDPLIAAICSNPQFQKTLSEETQNKQKYPGEGVLAILKEIAKDMRGDIDDDDEAPQSKTKIPTSAVTNPNARTDAVREIMAFMNSHEHGTTVSAAILAQADKVASVAAHEQYNSGKQKFDYSAAAKHLASLLGGSTAKP